MSDLGPTSVLRWIVALAAATSTAALAGCSGAQAPRSASATGASPPSAPAIAAAPVYRFVATGGHPEHTVEQADGSVAVADQRRMLVRPDGTALSAPAAGMGGIQVPARLGAGYLFWQEQLGLAATFLGDPTPFARLRTNVIDVMFGHDSLLLFGPDQERRAYALDPPRRVPLSPHGVVAIGGDDDDRVLAVDAVGRALASIDGGKTWKDVTEGIGKPQGVLGLPNEVAFVLGRREGAWLRPDGSFERRPLPSAGGGAKAPLSPARQLYAAVLSGRRGADGRVLLGEKNEVVDVDLATGAVSGARRIAAEGKSCNLHSAAGDGLATCDTYSVHDDDAFDVIGHALGSAPSVEKTFAHHPSRFDFGASSLAVVAPCGYHDDAGTRDWLGDGGSPDAAPSTPSHGPFDQSLAAGAAMRAVCVRSPNGVWTEYDARSVVGAPWNVIGWVGREGGAPLAIVWELGARQPRHGVVDMARGTFVILDADEPSAANASRWTSAPDGTIHGFTPKGTITIAPNGHVTHGARTFRAVASAGDRALARDDQWRLWQTTDGGVTWVEVARPPLDTQEGGRMMCGQLGCALDHPSGLGSWIRTGWPSDPPRSSGAQDAQSPQNALAADPGAPPHGASIASPPPAAFPESPVDLPRLVCTLQGKVEPATHGPGAGATVSAHTSVEALGGRRLPNGPAETTHIVPLRDAFQGPEDYTGSAPLHALRAVLRLDTKRNDADGLYVEPFDPTGRIRHASGLLGTNPYEARTPRPAAAPPIPRQLASALNRAPTDPFDESFVPVRPVLGSSQPGQAAGVVARFGEGRALWVSPSGAIRRVTSCGEKKQLFGAVVDASGKLSIACGEYSRAVDIIDAETGRVQFALPAILPWVWQPEAAFPLYGGGNATFLPNPDAIAREENGKLGVLRIPSEAPATVDDPAWFLSPDAPPVELAPWSKVEPANSPACGAPDPDDKPVRALIQTAVPWVAVEGGPAFPRPPGMTAIVRWGRRRICVEAIEVGYEKIALADAPRYGVQVMAVARFVGAGAGAGLVGMSLGEAYQVPATCKLEPAAPSRNAP